MSDKDAPMSNIGNIIDHSKLSALENRVDEVEVLLKTYSEHTSMLTRLGVALLGGMQPDGTIVPGFLNEAKPWIKYCSDCKKEREAAAANRQGYFSHAVKVAIGIIVAGCIAAFAKSVSKLETLYAAQAQKVQIQSSQIQGGSQ